MSLFFRKISFLFFIGLAFFSQAFAQSNYPNEDWLKPSPLARATTQFALESHQFSLNSEVTKSETPNDSQLAPKSKGKAMFRSMILPGWGENYAGRNKRAQYFFITEIVLWTSYAGFKIYENWIENEYKVFARTHAQADPTGKAHKYFVNIGNYPNIYEYNAAKLNYRSLDEVYPEEVSWHWQWDNDINRHDFKMMRLRSDNANYRALFTLGAVLVNHMISAIDAVWVTRTKQTAVSRQPQIPVKIQLATFSAKREYRIGLLTTF
jgi:hypothetical protein